MKPETGTKDFSRTPPPASLVPLVLSGPLCPVGISPPRGESPLSGEAYLANAVKIKVTHLHQKTPEYQHYRYRQGQQSALASPRRTARNERIPPNGFDTTASESTLHGGIPPPPNDSSPPSMTASPRQTARNERIPPNGFDTAAPESTLHGGTPPPPNDSSPPSVTASPRRTARNKRIPPNSFNTAAPESTLHRRTLTPSETKTFHLPAATGTAGGMPVPASRQTPASGQRLCSVRSFRRKCRLPDLWRR